MPTEKEYLIDAAFRAGYEQGLKDGQKESDRFDRVMPNPFRKQTQKPKRKMSAWNKYVKANSKKPRFRYRNGKLNLKKMGVAFRKTPAGRKKK